MAHTRPGRKAKETRRTRANAAPIHLTAEEILSLTPEERLIWAIFGGPPPIEMMLQTTSDFYDDIDDDGDITINGATMVAGVDF